MVNSVLHAIDWLYIDTWERYRPDRREDAIKFDAFKKKISWVSEKQLTKKVDQAGSYYYHNLAEPTKFVPSISH